MIFTRIYQTKANKKYKNLSNTERGSIAEQNAFNILNTIDNRLVIFSDKYLKTSNGSLSQIDHILCTDKAIYVIECKNYLGLIRMDHTSPNKNFWKVNGIYKDTEMYNPCLQNDTHISALKDCFHIDQNIPIFSIIAFDEQSNIGKGLQKEPITNYNNETYICHIHNLKKQIKIIEKKLPVLQNKQYYYNFIFEEKKNSLTMNHLNQIDKIKMNNKRKDLL